MLKRHLLLIVLVCLAVAALATLALIDPHEVDLPLCSLHRLTGLHCPGCGATRATHALLNGRLPEALRQNALFVLGLPVGLYAGASEWRRRRGGRPLPGDLARRPALYWTVAAVAVAFFLLRNLPWYPLTLLAPT